MLFFQIILDILVEEIEFDLYSLEMWDAQLYWESQQGNYFLQSDY